MGVFKEWNQHTSSMVEAGSDYSTPAVKYFIGLFLTATKEVVVIIGEQGPVYLYV